MKKIDPINARNFYIIIIIGSFVVLFSSLTYPWAYYTTTSIYPGGKSTSWLGIHGFSALFPTGYIGIICMVISIGYVFSGDATKAIITDIVGILCFGITFLLWPMIAPILVPPEGKYVGITGGYYIGLIALAIYGLAFLFLVENRKIIKEIKTEKVVIAETKKGLEDVEKIFCSACGTEVKDITSDYCNKCGAPLK